MSNINNNFYNFIEQEGQNISYTENGMVGYKTTNHPLLDTFYALSSFRNKEDQEIKKEIKNILESIDAKYILKFLFLIRDVREGNGERHFFRVALNYILNYEFDNKEDIISLVINELIEEYGRLDDLLVFLDTPYENMLLEKIKKQIKADVENAKNNKEISLLAKWLPSENTSKIETRNLARKLIKKLGVTPREYRKTLSLLREHLSIVEVLMSEKRYKEINYSYVPSKANLKYANAFLNNDADRRKEFLADLYSNNTSAHINSSVTFPHEIVAKLGRGNDLATLELLWKNLKQVEGLNNTIVVRDGSGSMCTTISNTNTTCLDVATALSIYCAEHMEGEFKNKLITFSEKPKYVCLPGTSLNDNVKHLNRFNECSNTNIEAVFDLILNTAINNNLQDKDIPKQILIISDMEFDRCAENATKNVFIKEMNLYKEYGFTMPKLIFWNVCGRTNTIPLLENENGVTLVSGFSVNTLKMVMSEEKDPFKTLLEVISSKRYERVPFITNNRTINKNTGRVAKLNFNPSWV